MLALEKKIREATENLKDWQENAESKISGPEDEIAATLALLQMARFIFFNYIINIIIIFNYIHL